MAVPTSLEDLPPTVAPEWRPRADAWARRPPSSFDGAPGRPLFIGACPRSGTTLLRLMLDNHPDMAIPQETNFVRRLWWRRAQFGDLRDPANRRRVAEWIFTDDEARAGRLLGGTIRRKEAIRRVADSPPTIGSVVQTCLQLYAQAHGKPRWGDKRPSYSGFIPTLFALFPDAQYINLVRDPRGAVASQIPMGWDAPEVALPAALVRWEGAVRRTDRAVRGLRPDQCLDLRYEDMVRDPRRTLEQVCSFAGLAAGAAVEAMIAAERRAAYRGQQERLTGPVTTASIERWRERLTPQQVVLIERATAPLLDRFGYRAADISAEPDPGEEAELARQSHADRREWRRARRDEWLRRARYRRPVAAVR